MKNLKAVNDKKLTKALELVLKAQKLIDEVYKAEDVFRYGSNTSSLINRISGSVSVLESNVNDKNY